MTLTTSSFETSLPPKEGYCTLKNLNSSGLKCGGHYTLSGDEDLDQILCWEYTRQIRNDWTIQFETEHFQIEKSAGLRPKQKVIVRRHLDDSISVWFNHNKVAFTAIEAPVRTGYVKRERDMVAHVNKARANKHKTPWGQFNPAWLSKRNKKSGNKLAQQEGS